MFNLLLLACLHLYLLACLCRSIKKNIFTYGDNERAKVSWSWTFNTHLSPVCRRLVLLLNFCHRLSCVAPMRASQSLASVGIPCLLSFVSPAVSVPHIPRSPATCRNGRQKTPACPWSVPGHHRVAPEVRSWSIFPYPLLNYPARGFYILFPF